jgi:hypothetical protein
MAVSDRRGRIDSIRQRLHFRAAMAARDSHELDSVLTAYGCVFDIDDSIGFAPQQHMQTSQKRKEFSIHRADLRLTSVDVSNDRASRPTLSVNDAAMNAGTPSLALTLKEEGSGRGRSRAQRDEAGVAQMREATAGSMAAI